MPQWQETLRSRPKGPENSWSVSCKSAPNRDAPPIWPQSSLCASPVALTRLTREVPAVEGDIDQALISMSSLLHTVLVAKRDTQTTGAASQAALMSVSRAIDSLVTASSEMARAHASLRKVATEKGVGDVEECPPGTIPGFSGWGKYESQAA